MVLVVAALAGALQAETTGARGTEEALAGSPRGPWRRLFLDAAVVEAQSGLVRVYHAAEKYPGNPVIRADKPWETGRAISGPYVSRLELSLAAFSFRLEYQNARPWEDVPTWLERMKAAFAA
jgi:hypothetical protein